MEVNSAQIKTEEELDPRRNFQEENFLPNQKGISSTN